MHAIHLSRPMLKTAPPGSPMLVVVLTPAEEEALPSLPPAYADALRLRTRGLDRSAIAAALGVPRESVDPLIEVATAKLAAATSRVSSEHCGDRR
jgi:DNA-directed RNA polymerase specialized sigma24 family protein